MIPLKKVSEKIHFSLIIQVGFIFSLSNSEGFVLIVYIIGLTGKFVFCDSLDIL